MLDSFRALSNGFAAKLLLALLVLSFAVWGIGDMVRSPSHTMAVATVGNAKVSLESYQRAVNRETENLRRRLGEHFSPKILKQLRVEQQVLQSLINQMLLTQETKALGLIPGDADVVRRIRSSPSFQDSKGNFDKRIFEAALRNAGITEKNYVDDIRKDIATNLIMETLAVKIPAPDIAVTTLYAARAEGRQATIYTVGAAQAGELPAPEMSVLQSFYEAHAGEFSAPETRTVSYAVIKPEDMRAKAKVTDQDIIAAYKERVDEFKRPERRAVNQLLYSDENDAKAAYEALTSGKSFEQIAKTTGIVNKNATSLGKVEKNAILEDAADAVFSLEKGKVTAPIRSPFGWHIFHVSAIDPPSTASIDEVRGMLEKDLRAQAGEDAQNKFINALEDALAGGSSLQETAKEFRLKVQSAGPMTADGRTPDGSAAKNLPDLDHFLDTVFKTAEKTESQVIRSKNGLYYVVRVEQVTPMRQRALEEVRGLVTSAWQKQSLAKRVGDLAAEISRKFANASERDAVSSQYHLTPAYNGEIKQNTVTVGGVTLPRELLADIFARAPGESTDAYITAKGNHVFAVAGEKIAAPKPDKKSLDDVRTTLEADMQNEIFGTYLAYLARKYPVEINEQLLRSTEE